MDKAVSKKDKIEELREHSKTLEAVALMKLEYFDRFNEDLIKRFIYDILKFINHATDDEISCCMEAFEFFLNFVQHDNEWCIKYAILILKDKSLRIPEFKELDKICEPDVLPYYEYYLGYFKRQLELAIKLENKQSESKNEEIDDMRKVYISEIIRMSIELSGLYEKYDVVEKKLDKNKKKFSDKISKLQEENKQLRLESETKSPVLKLGLNFNLNKYVEQSVDDAINAI